MNLIKNYLIVLLFFVSLLISQGTRIGNVKPFSDGGNSAVIPGIVTEGAVWENKISPVLKMSYNSLVKTLKSGAFSSDKFIESNKLVSLYKSADSRIYVQVLISSNDLKKLKSFILSIDGIVQSEIGSILVAEIPLIKTTELAERDEVNFVDGSGFSKPYLDVSRVECKADAVHNGIGLPRAYKGSGIVVGVVDSGIDWKHSDFKDVNGTRIKYLWDMSATGIPPSGYTYGIEYTKAQMDLNQCSETDDLSGGGHGTHVSGTAAGNAGANGNYLGIAPQSDIVFVKGFRYGPSFADGDVVNGCNYIFSKAAAMGKPCVINLSLGSLLGPHDGTSLYEQALSGLTGPGKIIVAAAGNEGDGNRHLSYTTGGSSTNEARQSFWLIDEGATIAAVDMWYNQPGSMYVGLAAYNSSLQMIGYTNPIAPGQKAEDLAFTVGGTTYGYVTIDATTTADPNNNARRVLFVIDSHNGQANIRNCYWTIYTYGSGTFDAWTIVGSKFSMDNNPPAVYPGDNNKTIGVPSTALSVLSIGSYVTKDRWTDIDGNIWLQSGNPVVATRSSFSSIGPSRDARLKPDISAPGEVIVATLSSFLPLGTNGIPRAFVVQGGKHQKMQGTSMASPHVAGTIALMLERNGTLTYQQVYNTLTTSARKDANTGSNPNNFYGYGKLDVQKAVQNTAVSVKENLSHPAEFSLSQNYPNPFNPTTIINYEIPTSPSFPLLEGEGGRERLVTLKVYDLLGNEVATLVNKELPAGSYTAEFSAAGLSSGVYIYTLKAGGYTQSKKMQVIK